MSYKLQKLKQTFFERKALFYIFKHGVRFGFCPICSRATFYYRESHPAVPPKNQSRCIGCYSIPRFRSVMRFLDHEFSSWPSLSIHESSPVDPFSRRIRMKCENYMPTHFFPDKAPGSVVDGFRNENLENQTFDDESFDLVLSQDVMEHVFDAPRACREIARTLRPGGAHVFTIPWKPDVPTEVCASLEKGRVVHHREPKYHSNPVDPQGALVAREWGNDIQDLIKGYCGLETEILHRRDRDLGLSSDSIVIFVTRKPK